MGPTHRRTQKHSRRRATAGLATAAVLALAPVAGLAGSAAAAERYTIDLDALNNTGVSGTTTITVHGTTLTVDVDGDGFVPNAPHAQHIHGDITSKDKMCPTMADDANGDGVLSTVEGLPKYGDIFYSLTTKGDTSKKSGLAVDRFPVADKNGHLSYHRTFKVTKQAAAHIQNLHYVTHGIDTNGNDKYDDSAGPSELDPKLPLEATAPAACGMIMGVSAGSTPHGGVETGVGPMSHDDSSAPALMAGLGGLALVGAGASAVATRRRTRPQH
jgi:hypothetical protein